MILISATPLNNRPQDLYYQLLLFQDARKSTLPITNLQSFFGPIIREYREIIRADDPNMERIRELYNIIRKKVISQITVRRTRRDLANYPKYLTDLHEQGIKLPEIAPLRPLEYDFDTKLSKLFYHTVFYLTDDDDLAPIHWLYTCDSMPPAVSFSPGIHRMCSMYPKSHLVVSPTHDQQWFV